MGEAVDFPAEAAEGEDLADVDKCAIMSEKHNNFINFNEGK